MPHIIVEYTGDIKDEMLGALHSNLAAQDTINLAAIKTRALKVERAIIGDGAHAHFVHITVKLLSGRPETLRQKIGADLQAIALEHINAETTALSIEVAEMDPATYVK